MDFIHLDVDTSSFCKQNALCNIPLRFGRFPPLLWLSDLLFHTQAFVREGRLTPSKSFLYFCAAEGLTEGST